MTSGSPMKLILGFSIPLLFGNLFQQFYSMVDTMIVGHVLGTGPLAASSSASALAFAAALPSRWRSASAAGIIKSFAASSATPYGCASASASS